MTKESWLALAALTVAVVGTVFAPELVVGLFGGAEALGVAGMAIAQGSTIYLSQMAAYTIAPGNKTADDDFNAIAGAATAGAIGAAGGAMFSGGARLAGQGTNTNGGAVPVRLGQAGETAVRSQYDIGPKASSVINGRVRVFDGLTDTAVSEEKNVARQSYTLQLRDSVAYAKETGRSFNPYIRPDTVLTGPLIKAIESGDITLRFIP